MDVVDILLLCVVGFSVLVVLLVQNLEESRKNESKTTTCFNSLESVRAASDDQEEEGCAFFQEIRQEEAENEASVRCEKSDENFDDWEGIERSELEKIFGEAVVFVSYKNNADKIDGDLKLQLYGLQKAALQGACHGSQPMAFNVSARAKWNAWQKLGDMSREMAMEKYVNILVKAIPGWKGECTGPIIDARSSED